MFELISRNAPENRRSVALDPTSPATFKLGQILQKDPSTQYAVLADGASLVTAPMWAFAGKGRLDVDVSNSVTIVEAQFSARVGQDGYAGSPVAGNALKVGTGGDKGKLVVEASVDSVAKLQGVVAYCTKSPDADGVIEFKAIR